MMRIKGPTETRRLLLSTMLGRWVLFGWAALLVLVGVVGYELRNSVNQTAGLILIAGLYFTLPVIAPYVDRRAALTRTAARGFRLTDAPPEAVTAAPDW